MNELISVIVPIYNVEYYLEECLESIKKQTYRNIEVLMIDDGSPDKSYVICEEYEKKDKRFHLYRKANGGLSSARNYGIEKANGKYVSFIDSDDVLNENFIYELYKLIKEYKADISQCDYVRFSSETPIDKNIELIGEEKEYTNIDALKKLVNIQDYEFEDYAVNKLYKKELFDCIRFPVGRNFEDVSTTYLLFEQANKVVKKDLSLYYYRIRSSSILGNMKLKTLENYVTGVNERYEYLDQKMDPMSLFSSRCNNTKYLLKQLVKVKEPYKEVKELVKKEKAFYKDVFASKGYKDIKVNFMLANYRVLFPLGKIIYNLRKIKSR